MLEPDIRKVGPSRLVDRRVFIGASVSALAGLVLWLYRRPEAVESGAASAGQPKMVRIVQFSDAGVRQEINNVPKIVKSDEEWQLVRRSQQIRDGHLRIRPDIWKC